MNNFKKTGVYNQIHEPYIYKYDKIDSEMMEQWVKDFKQGMIDTILMGDYKKEMKMNRVELEMQHLREGTGGNYMLNKMINTDGVNFFAEYTLYKDYDKYFGLTLDGESINIIEIMEEEFAEFLSHYRISAMYPQIQAVHEDEDECLEVDVNDLSGLTVEEYLEYVKQGIAPIQGVGSEDAFMEDLRDTVVKAKQLVEAYERYEAAQDWVITPEENESIKRQLEESKLAKFSPMYDEDDIEDEIKVDGEYDMNKSGVNVDHGSDLDIDKTYVNIPSMWTETPTNTGEMTKNSWTETSTNTVVSTNWTSAPQDIKDMEDNSKAAFISKVVADVMEELLTKGTCSLNITLKQD